MKTNSDKEINELNKRSEQMHKEIEDAHIAEVTALKKKIDSLEGNYH